jgi:hypothetical protein
LSAVSLIRRSWRPGRTLDADAHFPSEVVTGLRHARARRLHENASARALQGSLVSLAALIGSEVLDPAGKPAGKVRDVVVHWAGTSAHPAVKAIVIRSGESEVIVGARWIEIAPPASVRLSSTSAYARALERQPGDVALAHDVLDRQVVDSDGMQVVRPADVYLVNIEGGTELAGVEVGMGALLRRIGPRRLRHRFRPRRVIDWATIRSFSSARESAPGRGRRSELAGQTGTGLELAVSESELRHLRASEVEAALEAERARRGAS